MTAVADLPCHVSYEGKRKNRYIYIGRVLGVGSSGVAAVHGKRDGGARPSTGLGFECRTNRAFETTDVSQQGLRRKPPEASQVRRPVRSFIRSRTEFERPVLIVVSMARGSARGPPPKRATRGPIRLVELKWAG